MKNEKKITFGKFERHVNQVILPPMMIPLFRLFLFLRNNFCLWIELEDDGLIQNWNARVEGEHLTKAQNVNISLYIEWQTNMKLT